MLLGWMITIGGFALCVDAVARQWASVPLLLLGLVLMVGGAVWLCSDVLADHPSERED